MQHEPGLVVLRRYELVARIATGRLGVLWAALVKTSHAAPRLVAVKAYEPEVAKDERFRRAFIRPAPYIASVNHPNVVRLLDAGEGELGSYHVMEWVHAVSLAELLAVAARRRGTPLRVAARIVVQLCAGLHAAHELCDRRGRRIGICHRDMSPHKMFVSREGVAKLSGLGTSKWLGAARGKDRIAQLAPEAIAGGVVDHRADVFGLAALFYQLVSGLHPFGAASEGSDRAAPLRTKAPRVSEALSAVVEAALERDPSARLGSVAELRDGLEAAIADAGDPQQNAIVAEYVRCVGAAALETRYRTLRDATRSLGQPPSSSGATLARAWGIASGSSSAPPAGDCSSAPPPKTPRPPGAPSARPEPASASQPQLPVTDASLSRALAARRPEVPIGVLRWREAPPAGGCITPRANPSSAGGIPAPPRSGTRPIAETTDPAPSPEVIARRNTADR